MNITSKSRYALKVMIDLAEHCHEPVVQRSDIAQRQGVPLDYMDHILSRLREGQLVESVRGRGGGYRLARSAPAISALEIFRAAEDSWHPVACLSTSEPGGPMGCAVAPTCSTRDTWSMISDAIGDTLSGILLSDLIARRRHTEASLAFPPEPQGTMAGASPAQLNHHQECRAPRRRVGGTGRP